VTIIKLHIVGDPAPGGSKKTLPIVGRRGVTVVDDARGNTAWRNKVRQTARDHMRSSGRRILHGPLVVDMEFRLRRPNKHFIANNRSRPLRLDAPTDHTQVPDRTKLSRSTEDALTGVVWVDDAQIIGGEPSKRWCGPDEMPGVEITIAVP
jgi:Holliday junction resolvase RusA-like endonuclease